MLDKVIISDASIEHIESLRELMIDLGYDTTLEEMEERFKVIYSHPDYKTFIASVNNKVVGMTGTMQSHFYEQNGKCVRILALVASRSSRQTGIGKTLIDAVESWAKQIGATSVLLNCSIREERDRAHEFYNKRGYTVRSLGYIKRV